MPHGVSRGPISGVLVLASKQLIYLFYKDVVFFFVCLYTYTESSKFLTLGITVGKKMELVNTFDKWK